MINPGLKDKVAHGTADAVRECDQRGEREKAHRILSTSKVRI